MSEQVIVRLAASEEKIDSEEKRESAKRQLLSDTIWTASFGQLERIVGILVTFSLRWGLTPLDLGIYSGLRILLDNTSRSSLGIALGAVQRRVILREQGDRKQAYYLTNVAATANNYTSAVYGLAIAIWGGGILISGGSSQWGYGLMLIGFLTILKRRQDYQIAILRSDGKFIEAATLGILQNLIFAVFMVGGIVIAGFWGLLTGLALGFAIQGFIQKVMCEYQSFHPVRDLNTALSLAAVGLPIMISHAAWAMLNTLDRALILTNMPDGATQAGYYSLAILATNWCCDIGGRAAIVLYPHYQKDIGRGSSSSEILETAEHQAFILMVALGLLALIALPVGNWLLPLLFPQLRPGLAAFAPMLPGAVALAGTMPMREAWTALNRPWIVTASGCAVAIPQYFMLKQACNNADIAQVAFYSSVSQGCGLALLFLIGGVAAKWNRDRVLVVVGMLLIIGCIFTAFYFLN